MNKRNPAKSKTAKAPAKKKATVALISILGAISLLALIGSGVLQFALATAGCLKLPVATNNFMASHTYTLPGDEGYGPGIFNEYQCTEQEAKNRGYRHHTSAEVSAAESKAMQDRYEDERRFSKDKIDYKVYIPTGNGLSHGKLEISAIGAGDQNKQVFFSIKKDGYIISSAREGRAPNNYEVCTGAQDSCTDIGTDSAGRTIKKEVANRDIITYGTRIGDTFINIEGGGDLSTNEIIEIFNSLTEYK